MPYQAPQRSLQGLSGSGEADFHARARAARLRSDPELRPGSARAVFGRTAGARREKRNGFFRFGRSGSGFRPGKLQPGLTHPAWTTGPASGGVSVPGVSRFTGWLARSSMCSRNGAPVSGGKCP